MSASIKIKSEHEKTMLITFYKVVSLIHMQVANKQNLCLYLKAQYLTWTPAAILIFEYMSLVLDWNISKTTVVNCAVNSITWT